MTKGAACPHLFREQHARDREGFPHALETSAERAASVWCGTDRANTPRAKVARGVACPHLFREQDTRDREGFPSAHETIAERAAKSPMCSRDVRHMRMDESPHWVTWWFESAVLTFQLPLGAMVFFSYDVRFKFFV